MAESSRGGPHYPNKTTATDPIDAHSFTCPTSGCLFNVVDDTYEMEDVGSQHPTLVANMTTMLNTAAKTIWRTSHKNDPACKKAARGLYEGFYGPWKELGAWERLHGSS